MIELVIKWAIPFLCGGIATGSIAVIKYIRRKNTALENGVQCLLRAELIKANEKYIEKGYCPVAIKEALTKEYHAYHDLHGNDVATDLFKEIMRLPSKKNNEDNYESV